MSSSTPYLKSVLSSLSTLSASAPSGLLETSDALLQSFHIDLQRSRGTMLPSFIHTLPNGSESGSAVAVDLGGSTLRVAVIQLDRNVEPMSGGRERVVMRQSWEVLDDVKRLRSKQFFDWITEKIEIVLKTANLGSGRGMVMGVTWSFPIEQTSLASGKVQKMGKGYEVWEEILGTDLKTHFDNALGRRGLCLSMSALMNDTEATLLSHAFVNPATRISLICGTGCNAAVQLPLSIISAHKLAVRPDEWNVAAKAVIVNTEISMFGEGIFPLSRADRELDLNSSHPGFQILEQLTGGRYLGEICRLTFLAGIKEDGLLRGVMPGGMLEKFSFTTASMSVLEQQSTNKATALLMKLYNFTTPPSERDMTFFRAICRSVSERGALLLAIAIFTLWRLEQGFVSSVSLTAKSSSKAAKPVAVAFCGAVLEKHPSIRRRCQAVLDILVESGSSRGAKEQLVLEHADDSGLLGAAVGAVMHGLDPLSTLTARL